MASSTTYYCNWPVLLAPCRQLFEKYSTFSYILGDVIPKRYAQEIRTCCRCTIICTTVFGWVVLLYYILALKYRLSLGLVLGLLCLVSPPPPRLFRASCLCFTTTVRVFSVSCHGLSALPPAFRFSLSRGCAFARLYVCVPMPTGGDSGCTGLSSNACRNCLYGGSFVPKLWTARPNDGATTERQGRISATDVHMYIRMRFHQS